MSRITMVRKVLADGRPCGKCQEVLERLAREGLLARIDRILDADPGEPEAEGTRLARELAIERAPFFVVDDGGSRRVYGSYLQLRREVLLAAQAA